MHVPAQPSHRRDGSGGGVEIAKTMFAQYPNCTVGALNAETNRRTGGTAHVES